MNDDLCLQINKLNCHLSSQQNNVWAVRDVSLKLAYGKTLGIVGESGCGKSTLCKAIMGLLPDGSIAQDSEIFFEGKQISNRPKEQIRPLLGNRISIIFQDPSKALNPVLKSGKQIVEVLRAHRKISGKSAKKQVINLLRELGFDQPDIIWKRYPHQLSGGQQQRIAIAQALICNPSLLIADEPTTALDATVQAGILDLLLVQQQKRNMTIILVTHDLALVSKLADEVAVMYAGRLVELSDVDSLFNRPRMPYSAALLRANPGFNPIHLTNPHPIPGLPPNMTEITQGCSFAPRCPKVKDKCSKQLPSLKNVGENQAVACFEPLSGSGMQFNPKYEATKG